jgi:hypothetical protein
VTVRRTGSGRPVVNVTARRRNDMLLAIGRATSAEPRGERVRDEGSRARVREGSDLSRLASLSGGGSTLGARTASAQLPEEAESGARQR